MIVLFFSIFYTWVCVESRWIGSNAFSPAHSHIIAVLNRLYSASADIVISSIVPVAIAVIMNSESQKAVKVQQAYYQTQSQLADKQKSGVNAAPAIPPLRIDETVSSLFLLKPLLFFYFLIIRAHANSSPFFSPHFYTTFLIFLLLLLFRFKTCFTFFTMPFSHTLVFFLVCTLLFAFVLFRRHCIFLIHICDYQCKYPSCPVRGNPSKYHSHCFFFVSLIVCITTPFPIILLLFCAIHGKNTQQQSFIFVSVCVWRGNFTFIRH